MLRYAIETNLLEADLNRQYWSSPMFSFIAGDLYDIIPVLKTKFKKNEPVSGNCKVWDKDMEVQKSTSTTFYVTLLYNCSLKVKSEKVLEFKVLLRLEIESNPKD